MGKVTFALSLVCLLALHGLLYAAEEQPTAADWQDLQQDARQAREYRLNEIKDSRKALSRPPASPNQESPLPSRQMMSELLQVEQQEVSLLDAIIAGKGEHTRADYLTAMRQVKVQLNYSPLKPTTPDWQEYTAQLQAELEQRPVHELETKLHALAHYTPQRLPAAPLPKGIHIALHDFPHLDGSMTSQPLSTLIFCRLYGLGAESNLERILEPVNPTRPFLWPNDGVARIDPTSTAPGLQMDVSLSGRTHTPYLNLIADVSNIILVARPPSASELALAREKGVAFDLQPIGYDAFIFLLHGKNPLNSLTVQQLRAIYQDKVLHWSEMGGALERVLAFQQEADADSRETMQNLVLQGAPAAPASEKMIGFGPGAVYERVEGQENGIGYSSYYYLRYQSPASPMLATPHPPSTHGSADAPPERASLKVCAINGVAPAPATISNHSYPFVTQIYAVIRQGEAKDSSARRLRDWLLTPEGQRVVKESGYVPL